MLTLNRYLSSYLLGVCLVVLSVSAHAGNVDRLTREIQAANAVFMQLVAAQDADGLADAYTADGVLLFQGVPTIEGREGIKRYWAAAFAGGVGSLELVTEQVFRLGLGKAAEVGGYKVGIVSPESGVPSFLTGKYTVTWLKQNGRWKLFIDAASANE
jgi:uncharacterized protein (TIGR02246 family)